MPGQPDLVAKNLIPPALLPVNLLQSCSPERAVLHESGFAMAVIL